MKKQTWIIAAIGVAGIVFIYYILKGKSNSGQLQALPIPTNSPSSGISSYPTVSALPDFNVNATPIYMTINNPSERLPQPQVQGTSGGNCSGCCSSCNDKCESGFVAVTPVIPVKYLNKSVQTISSIATPNNIRQQFPESQFPWLYQNGQIGQA